MEEMVKRETVESIYQLKLDLLDRFSKFEHMEKDIEEMTKRINNYSPFRLEKRFDNYDKNAEEKCIDRMCWRYIINLFDLHKYMLCTDYEKMSQQIENFDFPVFTVENCNSWLDGLKDTIYENVKTLIKTVFERITQEHYYTGSGYSSRQKKKRNNNGVDQSFILTTYDNNDIFGYRHRPTIVDDLEKACYIIDKKMLPDFTIKDRMRKEKLEAAENEYFSIKVCKNGNTHFKILDENIRKKLNLYGPNGNTVGENIKIKVFEDRW